jgi:hypothetical protein
MIIVPLTQGRAAWVDDCVAWVLRYKRHIDQETAR